MNLHEIISRECVRAPLEHSDKKGVIDELVTMLADTGVITDPAAFAETVWAREQARSTGIGHGLAIPHGKSELVTSLAMAVGKPAEPIDFGSIDGKPVRLVVLLASPVDQTSEHIQALARISRLMTVEDFRNKIYTADDAGDIFDMLNQQDFATTSS